MVDLHSLPAGSRPEHAVRNNGPDNLALERYKLRELSEGWPLLASDSPWPATMRLPTVTVACIPPFDGNGKEESSPQLCLPASWVQSPTGGVYIDPRETNLMKQMKAKAGRGWVLVDALEVLIEQGIVQFELFTKRPAPIHIMRRVIEEQYSVRDNR